MSVGCRWTVKSFYLFSCVVIVFALAAGRSSGQTRIGPTIQRIGKEEVVEQDFARFTNRDVLTGEIEGIADGIVTMKPEMGENALVIPVGAVKEVVFKEPWSAEALLQPSKAAARLPHSKDMQESSFPGDRLVFVNGESLVARVLQMKEGKVSLLLPSSQEVEMDVANVAAIAFYRNEEVLAEEEFDGDLPQTISFEKGRWRTQRGWLLQSDSRATECFACLPLTQTGTLIYEWTVNTMIGRSTGLYFMASDPGLSQKRAYFVRVLRKYAYLYLCTNGEEVYCGSYRTSLYKSKNEVRLKCDSDRGFIEIWIDGSQIGRWHSSVPIKLGKYVILRADGRAAFDNFKVLREGAAARPDVKKDQDEGNALRFINGDKIAAEVTGISDGLVSFAADESGLPCEIEKEKLLYVRFDREITRLPLGVEGTVVLVTRSGDRISGKLLFLQQDVARIKSELAGTVDLRRRDVKKLIFREFP